MALIGRSLGAVRGLKSGRRLAAVAVSAAVLAWCLKLLVGLLLTHTVASCELMAIVVALLGVAGGAVNVWLLAGSQSRKPVRLAGLALWAALVVGGIAGSVEHLAGGEPGYGPVDARPRPPLAPLVFTGLGTIGAAALLLGDRVSRTEASR